MSAGNDPSRAHFSPDELAAIVDEASRLGAPVAAHAHSAAGIKASTLAGARTIEHGTFMDDESIRLMKEQGVYLVPTLHVGDYYLNEQPGSAAQAKMNELTRKHRAQQIAALGRAIKAGVNVTVGTDYVGFPVQQGVRELGLLVEAVMTPMQAIQAATHVNSELPGWQDRVGTIFSILRHDPQASDAQAALLQPCRDQVAAGYVLYGSSTVFVLSVGHGATCSCSTRRAARRWRRPGSASSTCSRTPSTSARWSFSAVGTRWTMSLRSSAEKRASG
jgi:Amidohydrolase family/Fructose-1-6-bisphosphatase, N-terminal domain